MPSLILCKIVIRFELQAGHKILHTKTQFYPINIYPSTKSLKNCKVETRVQIFVPIQRTFF